MAQLFGWKRSDGRRRFDKAFITTAKKSGKSTVCASIALYMMLADGEDESEVYMAAVDRDQASIIFDKVLRSVRMSELLMKQTTIQIQESYKRIRFPDKGSLLEAISSDADSTEGKNPHCLIADEMHVWRDRAFFNALMYGDIVRRQPLFIQVTTAGDDPTTIGFEEYEFAKALLNPKDGFYSQNHFAYIAESPLEKEWDDETGWLDAQPSLRGEVDTLREKDPDEPKEPRVLGSLDKIRSLCAEAKQSPRKQREFQRYLCNRWITGVENVWIDLDAWCRCGGLLQEHLGDPCWGGLDLSSTRDLSSLCLAFWTGEVLDLMWTFWTPRDKIKEHEDRWRVPLRDWVDRGFVIACPGEVIDYSMIRAHISGVTLNSEGLPNTDRLETSAFKRYKVQVLGYDPWNAQKLAEQELYNYDGIPMEAMRQGYISFNGPCKEFERLLASNKINHANNPVVTWMAQHCIVDTDPAGNIKPNKTKSRQKIDGIVSMVMAIGLAVRDKDKQRRTSPYSERGFRFL